MRSDAKLPPAPGVQALRCARCGAGFDCGARATQACWCAALPPLTPIDASLGGCLCPSCLARAIAASGSPRA
jgi:hypothetical protein